MMAQEQTQFYSNEAVNFPHLKKEKTKSLDSFFQEKGTLLTGAQNFGKSKDFLLGFLKKITQLTYK